VEMWVNMPNVGRRNPVFEWEDGSSFAGPLLFTGVGGAGALAADIVGVGNVSHGIQSASGLFGPNSWHHVAVTYDRPTGAGRIYLDGAIVAERNIGSFTPRTAGNLFIGRRAAPGFEETFLGSIDEPGVYNRALLP